MLKSIPSSWTDAACQLPSDLWVDASAAYVYFDRHGGYVGALYTVCSSAMLRGAYDLSTYREGAECAAISQPGFRVT